jgi:hypothetical protein
MRLISIVILIVTGALLVRWGLVYKFLYFPVSLLIISPFVLSYFKNKGLKFVTMTTLFIVSYLLAFLLVGWSFLACFLICNMDYNYIAGAVFYFILPFIVLLSRFNINLFIFATTSLFLVTLIVVNLLKTF